MFKVAPAMLVATMLTLLTRNIKRSSIERLSIPAGREYNSAEKFPANILPSVTLTSKVAYPYPQPKTSEDSRINIFESPSLAPGKRSGGKRFSSIKEIKAKLLKTAQVVILRTERFFIEHPPSLVGE